MQLNRENTEISPQPHKMWAEGMEDFKMTPTDIREHLKSEGWDCYEIDILWDNMQKFWRWSCFIKPLEIKKY